MTSEQTALSSRGPGQTADGPPPSRAGRRRRPAAPGIVGCSVLVLVLAGIGELLSTSNLLLLEDVLAMALFALATNLLVGYGGLVSFGQGAFFGAGAYTLALGWLHWHLSFWVALVLSPVIGGVLALGVGVITLRTRRLYFALLTLAFSQLFYVVAEEQYSFTQGANGIVGPMIPDILLQPATGYWFVLAVAVLGAAALWVITRSPFGLVLRAIRENRERAQALGVNVFVHQLVAFVISGAFCSVAGVLFMVYSQSAYPELFDWTQSGYAVFMSVIGGMFSFLGPCLGALVYVGGSQYLMQRTSDWQLVLGVLLLGIVLVRPDGLAGLGTALGRRLHRTRTQAGTDEEVDR